MKISSLISLISLTMGYAPLSRSLCFHHHLPSSSSLASSPSSDPQQDFVKAQLKAKEEAYLLQRAATQKPSAGTAPPSFPPLSSLPLLPYISPSTGLLTPIPTPKTVRASVYAIHDSSSPPQVAFVGVSRNVNQSLRMHLARMPSLTYGVKYHHIEVASRTLLEVIREAWIEESGGVGVVRGNDPEFVGGEHSPGSPPGQGWEGALDVKPLMTEEDLEVLNEAKFGAKASKIKEESAYKKVARRYEDEKVRILTERGVKESLRFDPKLKGMGLLDLYTEKTKDEIPKNKPPAL